MLWEKKRRAFGLRKGVCVMAYVQARKNKEGRVISYSIRVYRGREPATGKQLTPYACTWRVPEGWGERRAAREAQRQAVLFEQRCRQGAVADGRETFKEYAEYVLNWKASMGMKHLTEVHYRQNLERVLPALGAMRLRDIRPQHLNKLYQSLSSPQARADNEMAQARPQLWKTLEERGLLADVPDGEGRRISLQRLRQGKPVKPATAQRIADALGQPVGSLFAMLHKERTLSSRTVMNCHLLISTVLGQAEKEMLIPFNPARRATPPRREGGDPNYFQEDEVGQILQALESEPLKWKAAVYLLLVSGCRRGELLGLKWEKVDWERCTIRIDCAMQYAVDRGVYESTPKTKDSVRTLRLPEEAFTLLEEYRQWQQAKREKEGARWKESPYIFTGEHGGPMNPSQLGNWLTRFEKRHSLPHLNPHAFRHTMTSLLLFNGVDSISVSHRLGHSSVATTTSIYGHLMKQAEDRISGKMEELLDSARASASVNAANVNVGSNPRGTKV